MKLATGILLVLLGSGAVAHANDANRHARRASVVFTETNEAEGNRIAAFEVERDGALGPAIYSATGGAGSGDSLGSQAALVLSEDHRQLIAVNAGSNDLSVFDVAGTTLTLRARVPSGGVRPVSVTVRCGLVYVVHAGSNDVNGFYLSRDGQLNPIRGSHLPLSAANAGPGQIELSPDARTLVVSEKASNVISTYRVNAYGGLTGPNVTGSVGMTPFGFEFSARGVLVVSEAASASLSSYAIETGGLQAISKAVPDTEVAPCWVAIAEDRFAFTANAGSASISSYDLSRHGELTLKEARAADLGEKGHPLDLAFARDGRYLFVLDTGNLRVTGFSLDRDGTLQPLEASQDELPASSAGLAGF